MYELFMSQILRHESKILTALLMLS